MTHSSHPIDRLLDAVASASIEQSDVWGPGAVLDATVPHWRMRIHGPAKIRETLRGWYADPGRYEDLSRTQIPGGELVQFVLSWSENGIPHAVHQAHVLHLDEAGQQIASHVIYCGGRWPADLLAQMAEAADA